MFGAAQIESGEVWHAGESRNFGQGPWAGRWGTAPNSSSIPSILHSEAMSPPHAGHSVHDAKRAQPLTMLRQINGESGFWRVVLERDAAARSELGDLLRKPPGEQMGAKRSLAA